MNTDTSRLITFLEALDASHIVGVTQEKRKEKTFVGYGPMEQETEVEYTYGTAVFNVRKEKGTLVAVVDYRLAHDNTDEDMAVPVKCTVRMDSHHLDIPVNKFSSNYKYRLYKLVQNNRIQDEATPIVNLLGI